MKLKDIHEGLMLNKLQEYLKSSGYFNKPLIKPDQQFEANSGHDSGSTTSGSTYMPTGVPIKQRHRRYLGLSNRSGTIRL